jgi:hypothetical protein
MVASEVSYDQVFSYSTAFVTFQASLAIRYKSQTVVAVRYILNRNPWLYTFLDSDR